MIDLPDAVLARYPALVRPIARPVPLGNAGGLSGARLWRFDSGRGPIAARLWPMDGPSPSALEVIHGWILAGSGLDFIPVPIATTDGRTFVEAGGRLWELGPWMSGEADLSRPPPIDRIRAMFAGLATFHVRLGATATMGSSPGIRSRLDEIRWLISGGFNAFRAAIERQPDPLAPIARRWLELARGVAPRLLDPLREASMLVLPIQPCLRDARPDHFLFEGDRLTGLIDFGAMGRESIAVDLARLFGEGIPRDLTMRHVSMRMGAYSAYSAIRALNAEELLAFETIERANALLGAGRWVRWHFVEGRVFDDPAAVRRGLSRGLVRLVEREDLQIRP